MNPNHLLGRGGPRPLMTPDSLQWEKILRAEQLMDQKEAGNDSSDSLWYMTSVHLKKYEPIWSKNMALRVNGAGLILHAYVKGDHVGSQWAQYYVFNYVFEKKCQVTSWKEHYFIVECYCWISELRRLI